MRRRRSGKLGNLPGDLGGVPGRKVDSFRQPENQNGLLGFLCRVFFDINFPATAEIILENQYPDRIVLRIPYSNPDTERKMRLLAGRVREFLQKKAAKSLPEE